MIGVLALGVLALVIVWTRVEGVAVRLARETAEVRDATGALGASAIQVIVEPELRWAHARGDLPVLTLFRVFGDRREAALARLVGATRRHESPIRIDERTIAVLLHGIDDEQLDAAITRLGRSLEGDDTVVASVGTARAKPDPNGVVALVEIAATNMAPLQRWTDPRRADPTLAERVRTVRAATRQQRSTWLVPLFVAVMFLAAHVAFPAAPTPQDARGFVVASLLLLGLAAVVVPLARWASFMAATPRNAIVPTVLLAAIAAVTAPTDAVPLIGDLATLFAAFLVGAMVAALVTRLEFLLAVLWWGTLVDLWSFYSESGPTRQLFAEDSWLGRVLFVSLPDVGTYAVGPFVGFVDLLAIAGILACCHRFVIPLRRLLVAALVVLVATSAVARITGVTSLPMVPELAIIVTIAAAPFVSFRRAWFERHGQVRSAMTR